MPLELLQDSDSSLATIGPHWPSSYPEYLSPYQGKDEQRRIVWARLTSQRSSLAKSLKEQKERYKALRRELNPRTTQVESSHDPLYRDNHLSYDEWKQLQGGSQKEFVINAAMNGINDPCLIGEINCYRKEIRAAWALRDLEAETRARQHKISQEREIVEKVLKESMQRLEQARAYEELMHHIRTATSPPLSPHATPFIPRRNGPAEMPILAGEEDPTQRRVASRSPKLWRSKKCSKCGNMLSPA